MKNLILILLCLVAGVSGAEKFTTVGDSKLPSAIMDVTITQLNNGSRYMSRANPGFGWTSYDSDNSDPHVLESYIPSDTTTYLILEIGLNNIWDSVNIAGTIYYSQIKDMELLDRWYRICTEYNVKMGVVEMSPVWSSTLTDTANARILREVKERNLKRMEWCAYNNAYWIPIFDSLKTTNDRPNPAFYNADGIHYNNDGYNVVGRQIASYLYNIPSKNLTYSRNKLAKIIIPSYSSSKTLHHVVNLSKVKDTTFWNSIKPDGSNLALFINGVKTNRVLRDLVTSGNRGTMEFAYSGALTTVELKTGNYSESNTISYTETNLNRYYRLNEKKSSPTSIVDVVNGYNATVTLNNWKTYYNPAIWSIYNDSSYKKTLVGNTSAQSSVNTGISGATKVTYETILQIFDTTIWSSVMLFSIRGSGVDRFVVWMNNTGLVVECGQYTNIVTIPVATIRPLITKNKYHKLVVSLDLTQSEQSKKVTVIVDSTDVSASQTRTGTIGSAMPTFTDNLNIFGWYTTASYWPIGCTFKDIKFYTGTAITPAEAIADYKLQSGQFTVSNYSTTGSSRWDAFKTSTKSAYKKTWK